VSVQEGVRKKRTKRGVLLLLSCGIIGGLAAATYVFPPPERVKQWVLQQVSAQIGRRIEIADVRLLVLPRLRLELSGVAIHDVEPTRVFFRARRVALSLRVLSLLQRQIVARRLLIEEPEIELRRDAGGNWNVAVGSGSGDGQAHGPASPVAMLGLVRETVLSNGTIHVVDESHPGGQPSVRLHEVTARLETTSQGLPFEITLAAKADGAEGEATLSVTGQVRRAGEPVQIPHPDPADPASPLEFEGTVEVRRLDLRQIAGLLGPHPAAAALRGPARFHAHILLAPGSHGYNARLSDVRAEVVPLAIKAEAIVSGLMTDDLTIAMAFSSAPVELDELVERLPLQAMLPEAIKVIRDHEIGGTVEVMSAQATLSVSQEVRASFTGQLRVREAHALIGSDRTPARNVSGLVTIGSEAIRIRHLTGFYDRLRVTAGTGTVFLYEHGPWLDLEVDGMVPAPDLVKTLAEAPMPQEARSFLGELRETRGQTGVRIRLAGWLTEPDGVSLLRSAVTFYDVAFRTPRLREPVEALTGLLEFQPGVLSLVGLNWRAGASRFEAAGETTLGRDSRFHGLVVRARVDAEQLARSLPQGTLPARALRGVLFASAVLTGPIDRPVMRGKLGLVDAALSWPALFEKPVGTPAQMEWEATWPAHETVRITRFELHMPPLHLTGRGTVQFGTRLGIDLSVDSGPITVAGGAAHGLSLKGLESGTLEVSLDVKGRGADWTAWQYRGWIALTDGALATQGLDHPVRDIYLRLKLTGHRAEIKRLALRIEDSTVVASGSIRKWATVPHADLHIESPRFDLDLLIPKGERSPIRDALEGLAATSHLNATVEIAHGVYKDLAFSELAGRARIGDGALVVTRLSGHTEGGDLEAHASVRLPKQQPAEAEVSVRLNGIPFEKVERILNDEDRLISGNLSARATIHGHGRNPRGVLPSLDGTVVFSIAEGSIQRGTVLPKILGILSLPALLQGKVNLAQEGFPFARISGSLAIREGVVREENLVMNSPILKMSLAGNWDLTSNELDAVVAVSPLGSYSEFLKSIPLFGLIFAGERKGIDTALFEVTGTLHDPNVSYMPLLSFATGVTGLAHLAFDVLKNTVLLPKNLITGGEETESL
jgi:hypothetical protein